MLTTYHSRWIHRLQSLSIIVLSLIFLPLDTLVILGVWVSNCILGSPTERHRYAKRQRASFRSRNVLVTGVGMSKGLVLARLFYEAGHIVIGADFESDYAFSCGRMSKALTRFHSLEQPGPKNGASSYIECLLSIIEQEHIDLWVSCSGVASAVEDGEAKEIVEARTNCKAIQFDAATTRKLHEKSRFMAHVRELGLAIPETHAVESISDVHRALAKASPDKKFIMKPVGVDDARRGDMTLFSSATKPKTTEHLSKLDISTKAPWILQEFVNGEEYCTHALVVKGRVRAFVACASAELLMHYQAVPSESPLTQAMLRFTEIVAENNGNDFTGHLSFDFMVPKESNIESDAGREKDTPLRVYPIECNPRAHTAVVLFNGTPSLADEYLSLVEHPSNGDAKGRHALITPAYHDQYYWIGHDLVALLVYPVISLVTMRSDTTIDGFTFVHSLQEVLKHLIFWKDGTFERWDPWPWWWLYHGYWPLRCWSCFRTGKKWSRLNVSTTKMFEC